MQQAAGSEEFAGLSDDADAVVHLRVEGGATAQGSLRQAVARALGDAGAWRTLKSAFAEGGYEIHALERLVARRLVSVEVTNETVAEVTGAISACLGRWQPGEPGADVFVAQPVVLPVLPRAKAGLPEPPGLTSTPCMAASSSVAGRICGSSRDPAPDPAITLDTPLSAAAVAHAGGVGERDAVAAGALPGTARRRGHPGAGRGPAAAGTGRPDRGTRARPRRAAGEPVRAREARPAGRHGPGRDADRRARRAPRRADENGVLIITLL